MVALVISSEEKGEFWRTSLKHVRFICNICELTYKPTIINMTNYGTT